MLCCAVCFVTWSVSVQPVCLPHPRLSCRVKINLRCACDVFAGL
jgi:hypothetical protein